MGKPTNITFQYHHISTIFLKKHLQIVARMKKEVLILLLLFPSIVTTDYHADIAISVDESVNVSLRGSTNHPDLLAEDSQIFTSKEKDNWLLNVTVQDSFSNLVYVINLPEASSVSYIKSSSPLRIENSQNHLTIRGYGENVPVQILVQYSIQKKNIFALWSIVIVALGAVSLFLLKKRLPSKKIQDYSYLPARQKKIMEMLSKHTAPMTQAQLQSVFKIPKASLSRNIRSLELRGLLEKTESGMSNIIKVVPPNSGNSGKKL